MDSFDFIQAFGAYLKQDEDRAYVKNKECT